MNNRQQLNRRTIEKAFCVMGQYLLDRKTLGEIAIYGDSYRGTQCARSGYRRNQLIKGGQQQAA
jgi:hypothetical protein